MSCLEQGVFVPSASNARPGLSPLFLTGRDRPPQNRMTKNHPMTGTTPVGARPQGRCPRRVVLPFALGIFG